MAKGDPVIAPWSQTTLLSAVGRDPLVVALAPDEAHLAALARTLDLVALPEFSGEVTLKSWLDGAQLQGRWQARVVQTCGVSLEPFETPLAGDFHVRLVPTGSPNAPVAESEIEVDPEADDPPDVLEGPAIDLAAYLVEHLALEIDPFPRAPGAIFEPPEPNAIISPFAALQSLKKEG